MCLGVFGGEGLVGDDLVFLGFYIELYLREMGGLLDGGFLE